MTQLVTGPTSRNASASKKACMNFITSVLRPIIGCITMAYLFKVQERDRLLCCLPATNVESKRKFEMQQMWLQTRSNSSRKSLRHRFRILSDGFRKQCIFTEPCLLFSPVWDVIYVNKDLWNPSPWWWGTSFISYMGLTLSRRSRLKSGSEKGLLQAITHLFVGK